MPSEEIAPGLPGLARRHVAIAVSLALSAATAHAQTAGPTATQTSTGEEAKTLPKVSVQAEEETINVRRASSPKLTQDLVDTPQTIAVVSQQVLQQQGATTLSQALRNTPGVTFLLGENGNTATGDSIFMRGFDTQGSIFIDGIRDLGTVSRDTFNTEQVEIAKGPAGPDYGRSAASGYVNLVSKVPTAESFANGNVAYGTANNGRIAADINHAVDDGTALRFNVMGQDGEVDGRDFIERQSWAVAPSLALGLDGPTRAYFYLLHQQQENTPDGGVPTIGVEGFYNADFDTGGANAGVIPERVSRDNWYGLASDFEDIKATMFTARFEHDFNDHVTLRNTSRYGKLRQFYVLTGVNALTVTDPDPDQWTVARTRQAKFQENTLLTNQTNVTAMLHTGAIDHALTGGIEFIDEEQYNPAYVGLGTPITPANLYRPDRNDVQPGYAPVRNGVFARGETQTAGAYLFDTLSFADRWQVTAGFRVDAFDTDFDSAVLSTATSHPALPVGTLVPVQLQVDDTLFSYKVGVLFKPAGNGSIYLSHAISQQPPGGSNFTLSTAANNANNPNLDPTEGENLELGTKWEFRNGALAITGAVYDSKNKNELTPDPVDPTQFIQLGEREVKGVEIGIVGKVTENWELSAGIAKMDTEVKRGLANQNGLQITWSPDLTFTSWTTYETPFGLSIGGGFRYIDSVIRPVSSNAAPPPPNQTNMRTAPDYWVVDAMLGYEINEKVSLQLNAYNLTDEFYVATLNNSGARYSPGQPRSALLTVNFQF
ncbi:MAG TPA: catecholate siderophore receptor Fiu [Steroidobacteraceae bacterium]|nr:catecholate siderophore receptor Fiu [Steroidobacteraceae bacterium]